MELLNVLLLPIVLVAVYGAFGILLLPARYTDNELVLFLWYVLQPFLLLPLAITSIFFEEQLLVIIGILLTAYFLYGCWLTYNNHIR